MNAIGKRICIFGLDRFAQKNCYQINFFRDRGYIFDIFVTDKTNSISIEGDGVIVEALSPNFFGRIHQVWQYFLTYRGDIAHCELYVGGKFSPFYALVAKIFHKKILVVERGDIREYFAKNYSAFLRIPMFISYKLADVVWYKEMFMKSFLEKLGKKQIFFLPNCVSIPENLDRNGRGIDFLWANRLLSHRHPEWFAFNLLGLREINSKITYSIVGFMGADGNRDQQDCESSLMKIFRGDELENLIAYNNPRPYYSKARFFVFPSDYVFCNNALLEAMSYGVVPIVSDRDGVSLMVNDGVNGIVTEHSKEGLMLGMRRALAMTPSEWISMSNAAVENIKNNYSVDSWGEKLMQHYKSLS